MHDYDQHSERFSYVWNLFLQQGCLLEHAFAPSEVIQMDTTVTNDTPPQPSNDQDTPTRPSTSQNSRLHRQPPTTLHLSRQPANTPHLRRQRPMR
ncbi:hypothetical protein RRG08_023927 [Elysia crispata]|uniref:Uncharacterized protein n=1 Tax=Elysia crispata TaxID=231223 RepID=A0AAE1D1C9_9GAST|nr:hypothetical protein RRG08_023927 [Elysia crispata]